MNIQLKTGKTISISVFDYYFRLEDNDVEEFFEACVADDLGSDINNPFSNRASAGKLEVNDEHLEIPDIVDDIDEIEI